MQAMVACLAPSETFEDKSGKRHHEAIMRRLRAFVDANAGTPLYVPDICAAIGVAGSTLRVCCREFLGLSPLRYLWLRRMELARRALAVSDPAAISVTEIATTYGFWELGRFAVGYRQLFGESPSASRLATSAIGIGDGTPPEIVAPVARFSGRTVKIA